MSGKFDICFDARMIAHSGIGRYIQTLLPILDDAYHIAALGDEQALSDYVKRGTIISNNYPIYSAKEMFLLSSKIPSCKVFWVPHFNVPLRLNKQFKLVVTIHDTFHLTYPSSFSLIERSLLSRVYQNAAKKADVICTVSKFSAGEIQNHLGISIDKINVISNSLHPEIISSGDKSRSKSGVLYVGNQRANKNLDLLVEAYSGLPNDIQAQHPLILIGKKDPEFLKKLDQRQLTNVLVVGFVDDHELMKSYRNCKVMCMPSTYEGFGYPILEALASGSEVVCSDIPPFREHFEGKVSFFENKNAQDLTMKLRSALDNNSQPSLSIDLNHHYQDFKYKYLRVTELTLQP